MAGRKVRIFKQNDSMETCVVCCMLMAMDYFHRLPGNAVYPTRTMEDNYYRMLGYKEIPSEEKIFSKGTPLSAAACILSESGLKVKLCYTTETHYYPADVFEAVLEEFNSWIARGSFETKVYSGISKTGDVRDEAGRCIRVNILLQKALNDGKLIIAACLADPGVLHAVLLDSYRKEGEKIIFHVCNPATGRHELPEDELVPRMTVWMHYIEIGKN